MRSGAGRCFAWLSMLLLAACTQSEPATETPSTEPAQTGTLQLVIDGLPAAASADVTITGPDGFGATATESTLLSDLAPGAYELVAVEVDASDGTYHPDPVNATVIVEADQVTTVAIAYAFTPAPLPPTTGDLELLISGLPQDAVPSVEVTGPDGFAASLTEPTLLSDLEPGVYLIEAAGVASDPYTYEPVEASLEVTVEEGGTETAAIRYEPVSGAISLLITGLPSGAAADLTVTAEAGQAGGSAQVSESTTLADLRPGTYAIDSAPTGFDGFSYHPGPHPQTIEVVAGETVSVLIPHEPADGKILTQADGLGAQARVEVARITGPGLDGSVALETGEYLTGLLPGRYELSEALLQALIDDFTYSVAVPIAAIDVVAGETAVLTVVFTPLDGKLRIEVSGLPADKHASITVTGPGSYFNDDVPATATLVGLTPGTYTITADEVTDDGPNWEPNPVEQTVTVEAGETRNAGVSYFRPPTVCCF